MLTVRSFDVDVDADVDAELSFFLCEILMDGWMDGFCIRFVNLHSLIRAQKWCFGKSRAGGG